MKRAVFFLLTAMIWAGSVPALVAAAPGATAPDEGIAQAASGSQSGQPSQPGQSGTASQPGAAGQNSSSSSPQLTPGPAQATFFDPSKQPLVIPAGSILHVRLSTTLTSKTSKTGDKFTGMTTQPVVSGDKTLVPEGSMVEGHVTMVKPSGRVAGRASMRVVLDKVNTPEDVNFNLAGSLQDLATSTCTKGIKDNEGTIEGCGKNKKGIAEGAAIVGGMGAAAGATIGVTQDEICRFYGCPGQNPNIGLDAAYGAGIGAGTVLLYSLFKHEKQVVLVSGSDLTFVVNHTVEQAPAAAATSQNQ
ncbi:MAG TPA: hypothetical protein VG206_06430 [Terriglobia bacterium]|nr:hypothetical protein [Terriglobia bacterium]